LMFDLIPPPSKALPSLWRWHSSTSNGKSPLKWSEAADDPINPCKVLELSNEIAPNSVSVS
jgi:hypothetical protein